jgi:hypothetical protein
MYNVAYGFLTVGGFLTVLNIKTTVMPQNAQLQAFS